MKLIDLLDKNIALNTWQRDLNKRSRTLLTGLQGSIKALVMATAYENNPDKYVIITDNQYHASELYSDLSEFVSENKVFQYFSDDNVFAEFAIASKERLAYRLEALSFLQDENAVGFLIIPIFALRNFLPNPDDFKQFNLSFSIGDEFDVDTLVKQLSTIGFEKTQRVMSPGEFSKRGDILDIYPLDAKNPVRIEFFGDEIDGIRHFDVDSQLSLQQIDTIKITPSSDFILTADDFNRGAQFLSNLSDLDEKQTSYFAEIIAAANNQSYHADLRKFSEFFYDKQWTLLDYLPQNCPLFIDDFQKINEMNHRMTQETAEFTLSEKLLNRSVDGMTYLADTGHELRNYKPATFFSNFQKGLGNLKFDTLHHFNQHSMQGFFGQMPLLETELVHLLKIEYTIVLAVSKNKQTKLTTALQDIDTTFTHSTLDNIQANTLNIVTLNLNNGFNLLDEKIAIITENEIFGKTKKRRTKRLNITNAERLKDYNELEVGDYVVHQTHGIGKYLGLETIEIAGMHRDYLTIQYQNNDTISIPVDQVNRLTKYTAGEGKPPKVNKLNDGRWRRTVANVSKQIEDISEDLIKLYAKRESQKGYAFSHDDDNQHEFDEAFAYMETADQLRSVKEIKKDMERERPMDRLLVGDVGFGKTEVAMRAAFKAINDHKQVAILVPTTVLAEQHYNNFLERFNDFGVNIAVMSRFQTKKEQTDILDKLKKDRIDLIIGTHRLLSKDVAFFDLGLMIIDEEQRFGVKHKERLKELKTQVDVLTLTATPIPRTLHMSMMGIRDLSVIETPPTDRYPVQTYVMETNYGVLRDAVLREMSRGGQVFYVYNRVDTIEQKVSQIAEMIPEARVAAIHGQMSEIYLENTLLDFINGEYDVLVSTTIIETGVDIPNANTLFVENADRMGLSQLYQLRGRVGRSNRVAYAYFMYQPEKALSDISEKRLEAIKGFTELGSGFKIAMRDLSIRGAGNLLGAEQSGFIDSIGFDLYSQLLEEAVNQRLGKTKKIKQSNTEINLGIDAFLPSDYISDQRQKIEIYKRIREIESRVYYQDLQDELIDRFGEYPDTVAYLLEIGLLKHFADNSLVDKIDKTPVNIVYTMSKAAVNAFMPQDYFDALSKTSLKAKIGEERGVMMIRFDCRRVSEATCFSEIMAFTERLSQIRDEKIEKKDENKSD
ncbi:transcription-repair-coupling factor [Lactococcus hodotermopsidis]|uniref:Transcription-repair-coupling factor n=1 Tax=Pseudolactococcus hodotermopsidis TaxID=2709157 RepID=A0A6A0BB51_9LACT|nr:transcription-repair coupling factor [Lactococcus hodotermopsidis]GFH41594.1 transcription-repair-coupling factor [Lactococcus hodotermopsidis]